MSKSAAAQTALRGDFFGEPSAPPAAADHGEPAPLLKLPPVDIFFWIMKICATTLGETGGDLLSMTLKAGYALSSMILVGFFFVALTGQLASKKFRPWLYWAVILATSTAGTTMSDYMDRSLGLGYARGSMILVSVLALIFGLWRLSGQSFSVDKAQNRKVELLYWVAILFSNTLGTALGDFLADSSGLGFAGGAFLIGGLLLLVAGAVFWTRISRVFLFWVAFVLTRPFGATLGDLMTKPKEKGGLDLGTVGASLVLSAILVSAIVLTSRKSRAPKNS
jgi:uncharacterized membrane-anchored protein